jgi:hypothetical protein
MSGKEPFKNLIPSVLEIIKENEGIGFSNLHEKLNNQLKDGRGKVASRHTLLKCLNTLLNFNQIRKTIDEGKRGNPVHYYINGACFLTKFDESIEYDAFTLSQLKDDNSPFGFDANHYKLITKNLVPVINSIIDALFDYSGGSAREANFDYWVETELVPMVYELKKIVKPPLKMSDETYLMLLKIHLLSAFDVLPKVMNEHEVEKLSEEQMKACNAFQGQKDKTKEFDDIDYVLRAEHFNPEDARLTHGADENIQLSKICKNANKIKKKGS